MTDAACFDLVFNVLVLIGAIVFYRAMMKGARAVVTLSCKVDHGHGQEHALPCDCACHRATRDGAA